MIDEWLLNKPDSLFRAMFLELMELSYGSSSTVFCTQYRPKNRHARLGGGLHAEAIMDRIVHGTVWLETGTSTCATYTADGTDDTGGTDSRCPPVLSRNIHGTETRNTHYTIFLPAIAFSHEENKSWN
ncbi:MAG: hypothetical protein ACLS3M_03765 [Collinsella sp.]